KLPLPSIFPLPDQRIPRSNKGNRSFVRNHTSHEVPKNHVPPNPAALEARRVGFPNHTDHVTAPPVYESAFHLSPCWCRRHRSNRQAHTSLSDRENWHLWLAGLIMQRICVSADLIHMRINPSKRYLLTQVITSCIAFLFLFCPF